MADYGAVLGVMSRLQAKTALEFGPGSSTLALIEGGATRVDSCEDVRGWADVYRLRLERAYDPVTIRGYVWSDPVSVDGLLPRYDLALIDGPHGTGRRGAVIEYCLAKCDAVLVPTEDQSDPGLRQVIIGLAAKHGRPIELMETGPLSGGFALIQ